MTKSAMEAGVQKDRAETVQEITNEWRKLMRRVAISR